ncbi:unnamed protein product, partial [Rotaria sp. Silwood1]
MIVMNLFALPGEGT